MVQLLAKPYRLGASKERHEIGKAHVNRLAVYGCDGFRFPQVLPCQFA